MASAHPGKAPPKKWNEQLDWSPCHYDHLPIIAFCVHRLTASLLSHHSSIIFRLPTPRARSVKPNGRTTDTYLQCPNVSLGKPQICRHSPIRRKGKLCALPVRDGSQASLLPQEIGGRDLSTASNEIPTHLSLTRLFKLRESILGNMITKQLLREPPTAALRRN